MTENSSVPAGGQHHLPWLDGLRGIAALWVLLSHVQILSGMRDVPVLSWGGVAVDLFMLLSGFLMAHNYFLRRQAEPWDHPRTFLLFWTRRYFRLAPVYYVLLFIAIGMGTWLAQDRAVIASVWPSTATPLRRYLDGSLGNYATHLSFVFGMLPDYAFRTALPDWSIGLEMQFYLVFPFLMLAFLRLGAFRSTVAAFLLCLLAWRFFPGFFGRFEMPAFILMKLSVFMAGMWIAVGRQQASMTRSLLVAVVMMLAWAWAARHLGGGEPRSMTALRVMILVGMFYLMNNGTLPLSKMLARPVALLRTLFSGRAARFLGDTSYSTYLVHLLILLPVAGALAARPAYVALPSVVRFALCAVLVLPSALLVSWLLFVTVEKYGIRLGREVVGWARRPALPPQVPAEGVPRAKL